MRSTVDSRMKDSRFSSIRARYKKYVEDKEQEFKKELAKQTAVQH